MFGKEMQSFGNVIKWKSEMIQKIRQKTGQHLSV